VRLDWTDDESSDPGPADVESFGSGRTRNIRLDEHAINRGRPPIVVYLPAARPGSAMSNSAG
jgi:hypothetical protein